MPPQLSKVGIYSLEGLHDRNAVENGEFLHVLAMIKCRAVGEVATPVMADDAETFMAELLQETHDVICHRTVAVDMMFGIRFEGGGLTVTA